jgi:GxxExxY protein
MVVQTRKLDKALVHRASPLTLQQQLVGGLTDPGEMQQEGEKTGRFGDCSESVIGACIEVHRWLGPGLLESAYEHCLAYERRLRFQRQLELPVTYKTVKCSCGYRLDFVVEEELVVEIKAVERSRSTAHHVHEVGSNLRWFAR